MNNTIQSVHVHLILDELNRCSVIKKKRERAVLYNGSDSFYKLWVPNWTQGEITKHCFDIGFYNIKNTASVASLIHDNSGQRGYIQKYGKTVQDQNDGKSWKTFVELTELHERYDFILGILENSIKSDGTYSDFAPSNVIIYDKSPNLIDLESFRSFGLVFDGKKSEFEKFDLDAWWKPRETAMRDIDKYFRVYCKECLDIDIDFQINDRNAFVKMTEIIRGSREK